MLEAIKWQSEKNQFSPWNLSFLAVLSLNKLQYLYQQNLHNICISRIYTIFVSAESTQYLYQQNLHNICISRIYRPLGTCWYLSGVCALSSTNILRASCLTLHYFTIILYLEMSIILFIKSKGHISYIGPPSEEARPWARQVRNYHSSLVRKPSRWTCASLQRSPTVERVSQLQLLSWEVQYPSQEVYLPDHLPYPLLIRRRFFCLWVGSFSFWSASTSSWTNWSPVVEDVPVHSVDHHTSSFLQEMQGGGGI